MLQLNNIDNSAVGYTPGTPDFESIVSSFLGQLGTAADEFDSALAAILAGVANTDTAFNTADLLLADLDAAGAAFDAMDLTGLVLDFNQGLPLINSFQYSLQLNAVGGLTLPPLMTLPQPAPQLPPPPQTCVPVPAPVPCAPAPQPPGTVPAPAPPPPTQQPCAVGFIRTPADGCQPLPTPKPAPPPLPIPPPPTLPCTPTSALIRTNDPCPPNPPVPQPPPPPAPSSAPPPPIPLPLPQPPQCAPGFIYSPTTNDCVPEQPAPGGSQAAATAIDIILGGILGQGLPAGTNAAALFGGGLPLVATLPTLIATAFVPVISAFLLFNNIFGSWQAEFNSWAAAALAWASAHPIAAAIYQLQQQIAEYQAAQRQVGSYEYLQLQNLINRDQTALNALQTVQNTMLSSNQQSALVTWAYEQAAH